MSSNQSDFSLVHGREAPDAPPSTPRASVGAYSIISYKDLVYALEVLRSQASDFCRGDGGRSTIKDPADAGESSSLTAKNDSDSKTHQTPKSNDNAGGHRVYRSEFPNASGETLGPSNYEKTYDENFLRGRPGHVGFSSSEEPNSGETCERTTTSSKYSVPLPSGYSHPTC